MKKILFILGLASLLVTGCGDFFDTAPSNKIPTAIAFRTVTDVDNAVNGLSDVGFRILWGCYVCLWRYEGG